MTSPDERLPADFGKYRLEKRIAAGGMAEVFLAHRHESPHEPLVIKRNLPHISQDKNFVQMFTDEARMAANLDHPNVVRILDLGLVDGAYFIAMEYVHGEDIRRIYNRAYKLQWSLPLSHSIRVIADAAQGLAHAHQLQDPLTGDPMGLVHRDVSPQNILVTYAGDAKVVDFGIAKAAHKVQQTRAGQLKGKYSYMSPEQALGDTIDHRTDIFALGVILYETTTGTRLFKRQNELATLQAVMKCDFVPPHDALPNYPEKLEELLLKALALRPEDRWQDAAAFSAALYDYLYESGLYVDREQVGGFMRDLFADAEDDAPPASAPNPAADLVPQDEDVAPQDDHVAFGGLDLSAASRAASGETDEGRRSLPPFDGADPAPPMASESGRGPTVAERRRARSTEDDRAAESPLSLLDPWAGPEDSGEQTARGTPPDEDELVAAMMAAGFADSATPDALEDTGVEADDDSEEAPEPDLRNRPVTLDPDRLRFDTMRVRDRTRPPVEAPSASWPDDAAPTVAAVPSYRPPTAEPLAEPRLTPQALTPPAPTPSVEDRPPGESIPSLVRPVRSVPAYSDPVEPEASGIRRPTERTHQIRARAQEVLGDTRPTSGSPPSARRRGRLWLALSAGAAVALAVLAAGGVARWSERPRTGVTGVVMDPPIAPLPEAQLTVETEPGATVYLDDRRIGVADAKGQAGPYRVPAGRQMVRVLLTPQGFERERKVALQPNQNYHYEIRGRTGWLRLSVSPWAQVTVDGKAMGLTPLPRVGLLEGVHDIRLENPDIGRVYESTVRIKPGAESDLRIDLEVDGRQL